MDRKRFRVSFLAVIMVLFTLSGCGGRPAEQEEQESDMDKNQAGEFFISADGDVDGSYLDPGYMPDELDQLPADASACGMIYSFYGRPFLPPA